jgi:pimeloyl-ACP methyl ester carboxylesterase
MNCRTKTRDFTRNDQRAPEPRVATAARRDIAFVSGGVTCRAWVYAPPVTTEVLTPCIVMAHGLGGTREGGLEPYARRFAQAGFYVLLFDYRFLGASDGDPRQLISIPCQLEDWAAAIACARRLEGVDPTRIALWGTSLSGGHVFMAAAHDRGIAAISAQCPMLDGAASVRMFARDSGIGAGARLIGAALIDTVRAVLGREPYRVPLAAPPDHVAAMASDDAYSGCLAIMPPDWRNEIAARFFLEMPLYQPVRYAVEVQCPALIIACSRDSVASPGAAAKAAKRMGGSAELVELPIGHFDIYVGEGFEASAREQVEFFKRALAD